MKERWVKGTIWSVGCVTGLISAYMLLNFIGAVVTGIFIYYSSRPIYNLFNRLGMNKTAASIISPIALVLPAFILIAYTAQVLIEELSDLASETEVFRYKEVRNFVENEFSITLPKNGEIQNEGIINSLSSDLFSLTSADRLLDISGTLIDLISSVSEIFFTLFIAFTLSFYLLRDDNRISASFYRSFDNDKTVKKFAKKLDSEFKTVFFGNILIVVFVGILGSISFSLISVFVPNGDILAYPALIGFLCGITSIIPIFGIKIVYIPVTIILFSLNILSEPLPSAAILPLVFLAVSFLVVDTIPDMIGRAYIGGKNSDVDTGVLLFAYVFGPLVFGWYGIFLGPLIFVTFVEFYLEFVDSKSLFKQYTG